MIGMAVVSADGTIQTVNGAFVAMTGYRREELEAGMNIWDCVGPSHWRDSPEDALAALAQEMDHPTIGTTETTLSRKDGAVVRIALELAPAIDGAPSSSDDSDVGRRVVAIVDRTRIDALEHKVEELERYRALVDRHPSPIFAKEYTRDRQGVYIISNPVCDAVMGAGAVVGRTDHEIFPPEIADGLRAHDVMVLESDRPVVVEEQTSDARTGKIIDVLTVKMPLFDDKGWTNGIAGLTTDITEQKQLTRRLSALLGAIPDAMYRIDRSGTLLDFKDDRDPALAMVPDLESPDGIIGRNLRDLPLPDEVKELTWKAITETLESDRSDHFQDIEYKVQTRSGTRHVEARIVRSDHDEVVAIVRDITEGMKSRLSLEQLNLELRLANDELRQFAHVASHDLQEPLRTVRSFAELIASKYRDQFDDRGRKWLDYVVTGAQRMRDLIDDLLAYSQAGQARRITAVNIAALVAAILHDLRSDIDAAAAEVTVGELPTVEASDVELRQVFQNLISNALKFRRRETAHRVSITAERDGQDWIFAIEDNGIGIEPTYHAHIFQMFQRLHQREDYGGTGIGLALVKKIVEGWNGTISVRSDPGQGSIFRFTIPGEPSGRALPES